MANKAENSASIKLPKNVDNKPDTRQMITMIHICIWILQNNKKQQTNILMKYKFQKPKMTEGKMSQYGLKTVYNSRTHTRKDWKHQEMG